MPIIYRLEKGSPLTLGEIDQNFHELDDRLHVVEENHANPLARMQFRLEGMDLIIQTSEGALLQKIPLPVARFRFRGAWRATEAYGMYDYVAYRKGLFLCVQAHESTSFETQADAWHAIIASQESPAVSGAGGSTSAAAVAATAGGGALGTIREQMRLPIWDRAGLPPPMIGSVGFITDAGGALHLVYANGSQWRKVINQEVIG